MTPEEYSTAVDAAVVIADGFFQEGPIDWDDLLYRLEEWTGIDLPDQMDDPELLRLMRDVRKIRRES